MKHGIAPYIQASEKLGLSRSGWGWDCRLADFDNSGMLQAIQAVGFIKGKINRWPELQSLGTSNPRIVHDPRLWPSIKPGADLSGQDLNPFFVRAADGHYYDIGREVGFTEPMVTKAIALADVYGDGRLDFAFGNQWEPSSFTTMFRRTPARFSVCICCCRSLPTPARRCANGPDIRELTCTAARRFARRRW